MLECGVLLTFEKKLYSLSPKWI